MHHKNCTPHLYPHLAGKRSSELYKGRHWTYCFVLSSDKYLHANIGDSGPGSVVCIATGYGLDGPGIESRWGARFSAPVQTGPGAHPASCVKGTESFPGVMRGRGVKLTPHPLLVPWSWKSRAIHLHPLWAVRLVQSLSACTRVHFTFNLTPVENENLKYSGMARLGDR
jgi:hypothetical protein